MLGKQAFATAIFFGLLSTAVAAPAQQNDTLRQLQQQLDQQARALKAQRQALERTRRQLEKLQARTQTPPSASRATQPKEAPQQQVGKAPPNPQEEKAAQVAPVLEQPGVLTPAGHFVLAPSLQYSYSTSSRVALTGFTVLPAIVVGLIDVRQINSTTIIGALTGRYGLTNRLELDVKVPYVYRHDDTVMRILNEGSPRNEVFNASGHHLGDVEVALRYQFNDGHPGVPYFIGSLRGIFPTGKSPFDVDYATNTKAPTGPLPTELATGSGFYGVQTGLQMIYPSDPAVLFAGISYLWRIQRDDMTLAGKDVGTVDPGDSIQLSFGMGLALNARSSFSVAYNHTYIGTTHFGGETPSDATDTQLSQLLFGYAYRLTPDTSLNLTIGAGLTRNTPDVAITLRVPMQF